MGTLYENYSTSSLANVSRLLYEQKIGAQTFLASSDHFVSSVNVWASLYSVTAFDMSIAIQAVTSNVPNGVILASSPFITTSAWTTSYGWRTIDLTTTISITNGTTYGVVGYCTAAPNLGTQGIRWGAATTAVDVGYTDGLHETSQTLPGTWVILSARDFYFGIYGSVIAAGSVVPFATSIAGVSSVSTIISEIMSLALSVQAVSLIATDLQLILNFLTSQYGISSVAATLQLVGGAIQAFSTSIYATSEVTATLKKLAYLINILSTTQVDPLFAADSFDSFLVSGDIEVQNNAYAPLIEALLRFGISSYQGINTVFAAAGGTIVTIKGGVVVGLS
jgi:hypothetical protein